jgi:hypothetical protein
MQHQAVQQLASPQESLGTRQAVQQTSTLAALPDQLQLLRLCLLLLLLHALWHASMAAAGFAIIERMTVKQ